MKIALCPAWAFVPTLNVGHGGTTGRVLPNGRGFTYGPWSDIFSSGGSHGYVWFGAGHDDVSYSTARP